MLRRSRKSLLSDLSALVKTAKRLQDVTASSNPTRAEADLINSILDDMIMKAFRIVIRGVRFLDSLEYESALRPPLAPVDEADPLTPPAETTSFHETPAQAQAHRASLRTVSYAPLPDEESPWPSHTPTPSGPPNTLRPRSLTMKRQSISHRLSTSLPAAQRKNLVSERLNAGHDLFLSYLGSFIGRLHLQSQSSVDLIQTIKESVTAGREMLTVVEALCAHDTSAESLDSARNVVYEKINRLVLAARDMMTLHHEGADVVMPQQNGKLLLAATGCVKAAGECVARAKFVIERTGDFEFELEHTADQAQLPPATTAAAPSTEEQVHRRKSSLPLGVRPLPPPLVIPTYEKPLPDAPITSASTDTTIGSGSPHKLTPASEGESTTTTSTTSTARSSTSFLPPLQELTGPLLSQDDLQPTDGISVHETDSQSSFRSGSISIGTNSTYVSSARDSEISIVSRTSTRATTPDLTLQLSRDPSHVDLGAATSPSTLVEDAEEGESQILERTYAHELMHNKDGQITGGTLAALVERLTTHDSTPDAMFVSTFYLTFRLFVTPQVLATALIDRFDYVAESDHIAAPVRLRVYNVFKGWLESHWRNLSDHESLDTIQEFAQCKLGKHLPAAGRRLLELCEKVSNTDGPLVPRLVSSMGKTSTSIAQYIPADTPLPVLNMSKSQMALLKNWKQGGSSPSILDFDPLELARQITIKEMTIFCAIMPEELLGSEWTKRSGSNAINVRAMSTLSTDLSNLVADTILQYEDAKKRATIIKHWIKTAQKCLELNNYDSLMAIICSLNSSTIVRLKRTWDIVSAKRKELLKSMQAIVEPDKNYATLRKRLHDHVPPCLPFVGTYLTDLTFVDAGNPPTKQLPGVGNQEPISVINFDKHTRTAKIIGELQRFQLPYRLTEIPELQEWLQAQIVRVKSTSEHENVQQYYRKSLLLEPRDIMPVRPSPIESLSSSSISGPRDRFDLFSWTRDRTPATNMRTPLSAQ